VSRKPDAPVTMPATIQDTSTNCKGNQQGYDGTDDNSDIDATRRGQGRGRTRDRRNIELALKQGHRVQA